jgi:VWFA-related protein
MVLAGYCYSQDVNPVPQMTPRPAGLPSMVPTPVPAATPKVVENDIVKITTTLVQLDITIVDKAGRTITDIKPGEIEIFENGEKQDLSNFSFVSVANKQPVEKNRKNDDKIAVPVPSRMLRPEEVRRTIALVVDDLTLSFESASKVKSALKKFVNEQMQDGDLVGIIRTGTGAGSLQGFTSDKRQLLATVERIHWNGAGRGRINSFAPIEPTTLETVRAMNPDTSEAARNSITDEQIKSEKDFLDSAESFRDGVFVTGTLGALDFIVEGMRQLPGRKSVILFSDGFRILQKNEMGSSTDASRILEFLRKLAANANRAAVVIHTIDSRGLETTSLTAQDRPLIDPLHTPVGRELSEDISDRASELFETQQGLVYLAKKTGGLSIINRNDISGGVEDILDDQSYYLVAFQPKSENYDAVTRSLSKIEVKVSRDGAKVRYRSEFTTTEEKSTVSLDPGNNLMKALVSPFAINDINVKVNSLFGYSKKRGYYVHSFLYIDPKDLSFKKLSNGEYESIFDILAISYGDNGLPVDKMNIKATLKYKEDIYQKFLQRGFAYSFIFPIKKPGAIQMRVGLVERGTGKMGSASQFVEIPNLKKEGLTLSGVVLQNMTNQQWERFSNNEVLDNMTGQVDPIDDTARRRFKRDSVLRFGVEIYNSKLAPQQLQINLQARLYHEGKLVYQSKELPLTPAQIIENQANFTDAVLLGKLLLPGDYIVQVVAMDTIGKRKIATQFVQFEVVE